MLLCRQEKPGKEYWLLPGGGVDGGETIIEALRRELREELGVEADVAVRGPGRDRRLDRAEALGSRASTSCTSSSPPTSRTARSRTSRRSDAAVKGARLFSVDELEEVVLHPPIKRFLSRWQPGDPAVYLGALWALGS